MTAVNSGTVSMWTRSRCMAQLTQPRRADVGCGRTSVAPAHLLHRSPNGAGRRHTAPAVFVRLVDLRQTCRSRVWNGRWRPAGAREPGASGVRQVEALADAVA